MTSRQMLWHEARQNAKAVQSNASRGGEGHCHKLIAQVAKAMAGELYEGVMGDNELWATWQRNNPGLSGPALEMHFIAKNWGRCVPRARATLAGLLSTGLDDESKETIMEALLLDNTLRRGHRAQ